MKHRVKLIGLICLLLLISSILSTFSFKDKDIDKILETDAYSYLPSEAKEYVKSIYEETGNIVLTEKNKEENKVYLNPEYVTYLSLTDEEKSKLEIIPESTILDYPSTFEVVESTYPSAYDLRDINGMNYITPNRNQGSLGICWAFASSGAAESYILKSNNETYSTDSTLISERQMDYVTSIDGISDYDSEYVSFIERKLGDGGNFFISTVAMSSGVSLINYNSFKSYNARDLSKMELYEVINYSKSLYEVNSTINMPILDLRESTDTLTTSEKTTRNAFISIVKENIMNYGASYMATYMNSSCYYEDSSSNTIIDVYNCNKRDAHAMEIIGWDDTYEYSYCADTTTHTTNLDGCSNIVSGKGVWILKNSWGTDTMYPYLTYDSLDTSINFITDMTDNSNWDNNYILGSELSNTTQTVYYLSNTKIKGTETLNKIKFFTQEINGTYEIYVYENNGSYKKFEVTKELPGLTTVDINMEVTENTRIEIKSDNAFIDKLILFTSNKDTESYIDVSSFENLEISSDTARLYSDTKNIPSGSSITYKIYNSSEEDVTDNVTITNNIVAENNVNTLIDVSALDSGTYKVEVIYGDYKNSTNIIIPKLTSLEGDGTETNPYKIHNEEELNEIRYHLSSYFILENDITLENEWTPIGTSLNPFSGGIDGNGHTISNLKIESDSSDSAAFIAYFKAKYSYNGQTIIDGKLTWVNYNETSYLKNIIFKDANVSSDGNASILIGNLSYDTSDAPEYAANVYAPELEIENIELIGGTVTSKSGNAGSLISYINIIPRSYNKPILNINKVFTSTTISGLNSSGLIGYINDSLISGSGIMLKVNITNFENMSEIDFIEYKKYESSDKYSSVVGFINGNAKINLENYIINTTYKDINYNFNFFNNINTFSKLYVGNYDTTGNTKINLTNGYYLCNNTQYCTKAKDITLSSLYTNWTDFDTYWKLETIDDIPRIPILNDVDFNYTEVSSININKYDTKSLYDYISIYNNNRYINYSLDDNDIIKTYYNPLIDPSEINGTSPVLYINALNNGTIVINIDSNYDGYSNDINITVTSEKKDNPVITYYSDNNSYTQLVKALESFTLDKNKFEKTGYIFKGWSTIDNSKGTYYADEEVFNDGIDEDLRLYAMWERKTYTIKFDANGGTGEEIASKTTMIDYQINLPTNTYEKTGYTFKEWNTSQDGTGESFKENGEFSLNELSDLSSDTITLYAIWEKNIIINNTLDIEKVYDGNSHTVSINLNIDNYNIKYSLDGINYNLDSIPTFKNVGEYKIYYKVTKDEYDDYYGSNSVNIYGIKSIDESLTIKDNMIIDSSNDFNNIKNKFDIYSNNYNIKHLNSSYEEVSYNEINTSDILRIVINDTKIDYSLVHLGDVDGNGNIGIIDYVRVMKDIMNTNKLSGVYFEAADMNRNGKIDIIDYVRIMKHIMGE